MDASRIKDEDYLDYLPGGFYRNKYRQWKRRMIDIVDELVALIESKGLEEAQRAFVLTDNDIALLVRLNFVDKDFAERTGMAAIERVIPQ